MPQIDRKSGEVVIRIIFDGPPEAGKTSTIDYLASLISLQRRSPVTRPGTTERRTEFFDWVDFSGGFLDGHRVRCQLLSVPGQSSLLHRRRYLLDTADVIVFVADATADRIEEVRSDFQTTLKVVTDHRYRVPVGIVLQVNKQDLPGALSSDVIASALELPAGFPVIGTSAREGNGVMQTLILAVRLATDRVRAVLLEEVLDELLPLEGQPDELHRAMLALEPALEQAPSRLEEPRAPDAFGPSAHWRDVARIRRRPNPAAASSCALPQAASLPAGCIWPAVSGRAALAAANQARIEAPVTVADFAPPDAFELESDNGWVFHSRPPWTFGNEADARLALLGIARRLAESADLLPEGRALLIGPAEGGWRLWMVTRQTAPISELIATALESADVATLAQTWIAVHEFTRAASKMSRLATSARLNTLAAQRGRMVVLTLPKDDEGSVSVAAELDSLLEPMGVGASDSARCVASARDIVLQHLERMRRKDES